MRLIYTSARCTFTTVSCGFTLLIIAFGACTPASRAAQSATATPNTPSVLSPTPTLIPSTYLTYEQAGQLRQRWANPSDPLHAQAQGGLGYVGASAGEIYPNVDPTTGAESGMTILGAALGVVQAQDGTYYIQLGIAHGRTLLVAMPNKSLYASSIYISVEVGAPDAGAGLQNTGELVTLNLLNTPGAAVGITIWEYKVPIPKQSGYADDLLARDAGQQQQIVAALKAGTTNNSPAFAPLTPSTNPDSVPVVFGVWTVVPIPNIPIR